MPHANAAKGTPFGRISSFSLFPSKHKHARARTHARTALLPSAPTHALSLCHSLALAPSSIHHLNAPGTLVYAPSPENGRSAPLLPLGPFRPFAPIERGFVLCTTDCAGRCWEPFARTHPHANAPIFRSTVRSTQRKNTFHRTRSSVSR